MTVADPAARSLADLAYEQLKADIISGRLEPDQLVTEAGLAVSRGFGRTPIREALVRLGRERLVRVLPRRGYLVAALDVLDILNLYSVRLLLEPEAARLAAGRVSPEEMTRLEAASSHGYRRSDPTSVGGYVAANSEFHVAIAKASGNRRLAEMVSSLMQELERVFQVGLRLENRTDVIPHDHAALVEALLNGNGEAAAAIARQEILASQDMVVGMLLRLAQRA